MTFNEANTVEQMALTARGDMPPPNLPRLTLLRLYPFKALFHAQSCGGGIRPLPHQWRDDTKRNRLVPEPLKWGRLGGGVV